jgi:hypothetical protein
MVSMLDWDASVNPEMAKSNETRQRPVKPLDEIHEGVVAENLSPSDPLIMLKHFGPGNARYATIGEGLRNKHGQKGS